MENPNYAEIVSDAAKYLDGTEPGWHKKIDRATLRISGCTRCIMGQLYGDYAVGMRKHFPTNHSGWDPHHPLGPAFGDGHVDLSDDVLMETLRFLWLHEINARLEADLSPVVSTKGDKAKSADAFIARTNEIINQPLQEA
mgnify:CR=1 FL=1